MAKVYKAKGKKSKRGKDSLLMMDTLFPIFDKRNIKYHHILHMTAPTKLYELAFTDILENFLERRKKKHLLIKKELVFIGTGYIEWLDNIAFHFGNTYNWYCNGHVGKIDDGIKYNVKNLLRFQVYVTEIVKRIKFLNIMIPLADYWRGSRTGILNYLRQKKIEYSSFYDKFTKEKLEDEVWKHKEYFCKETDFVKKNKKGRLYLYIYINLLLILF